MVAISLEFNAIIPEKIKKKYSAHKRFHKKSQLTAVRTDQGDLLYG